MQRYAKSEDFEKTTVQLINRLKAKVASEEEFTTRFCEISYSPETVARIAYIFDRLSNAGVAPGERILIFSPDLGTKRRNYNIEHFLPKANADQEPVDVVDNIGNLLLISFRTNSSLGNLSPSDKLKKLNGDLLKKIQNLDHVRTFIHKYGDRIRVTWGKSEIEQRARDLAAEAYEKIWKIN